MRWQQLVILFTYLDKFKDIHEKHAVYRPISTVYVLINYTRKTTNNLMNYVGIRKLILRYIKQQSDSINVNNICDGGS